MAVRPFNGIFPKITESCYVDGAATIIGDVTLAADVSVWPAAILRGDVQKISVGARSNIQDGSVLHVTHDNVYQPGGLPLIIGAEVTVGHQATLHACTIEDRCLIGMKATVLDGAKVESLTMIAAGGLVPPGKCLESGYLWVGAPVKKIRPLTKEEIKFLSYSAEQYSKLKDQYLGE
ncbi:carnitine operon protein CaiE [Piscirickettsia salmonis]|uniref:Carbonic anhydrase/acetyltransferase, isoleucine patch superfamily n=1 Tax=Piscirickettsia salmonis TaxID=1238 RepID=A0A1L6TGG0_PISSA|nr:gamma carbonic anhydrase family protein [Piscirickettsia salmonis]ALB21481.1 Carbonic anhydrase/acetyltransferase, isoleucine patch superfamily [Piscirickettsia salmonis]ALY01703.1 gamma carbonic anhydrase family protein [Piscirickettsia salmonis]AMA41219.1 gamma carbonic anhydrase family protein [Piscirickettsia salmonis]AOS36408.1 gamma carbonic anhydrase family protein [Piscirickettsia salmonis]APS61097.1 gamma carbonic anhydrase family protein [Piscirickettsia salmonis]